MIIVGQHRNERLALRHLRDLRREYAPRPVELLSRRNARGEYSARGHYFWFEVGDEPEKRIELVAHFDYASTKAKDLLRFQVHILAPGSVTDDEALGVISDHFNQGKKYPQGWREKVIYWGHVKDAGSDQGLPHKYNRKDPAELHLARLAIGGGERKVSRRNPVRTRRRAGRKAEK